MIIILTIFQYMIQAAVDLLDKFLITARKIEPVSYTFYTVVTGALLLVLWPWNFAYIPTKFILLDLFSGVLFSLAFYVFFVALSKGEVSRVVPFVFGLVPVFDILVSFFTGRDSLSIYQFAAMCLLIPGALVISHQKGSFWGKHVALKTLSAFLFSLYYAFWQFGSQVGPVLNNLMWNRLGAAVVLVVLLLLPAFRRKVLSTNKIKNKTQTSFLFLFKQVLGGANFIFLSFLLVLGKIAIVNGLQGFRYIFLILFGAIISSKRKHLIEEESGKQAIWQKVFGAALIFAGTLLLFV